MSKQFVIINDGKTLVAYNGNDSKVVIPDGVEEIRGGFTGKTFKSIVIPEGVKRIKTYAFSSCQVEDAGRRVIYI